MQSGATPPPRLLLEIVGVKGYTPYKPKSTLCVSLLNSKTKKSPRNRLFSTFLCQTLKGFISRLVEIARCDHYAVITTHLTVIKGDYNLT